MRFHPRRLHFSAGDTVYIYNSATRFYLGAGEAWGTQCIVAETGERFVAIQQPDCAYRLWNSKKTGCLFRSTSDWQVGTGVKYCFIIPRTGLHTCLFMGRQSCRRIDSCRLLRCGIERQHPVAIHPIGQLSGLCDERAAGRADSDSRQLGY